MSDEGFLIDGDTARRLGNAVRRVEAMPLSSGSGTRKPIITLVFKIGVLTTSMTARAGLTPGSGTVQPYTFNGTALASSGSTITVYNWTGSTVTSGTVVNYATMDGYFFLVGNDCSGEAI